MKFTYDGYIGLINLLKRNGYMICGYHDWMEQDRCVILRHDVDNDLQRALKMAEVEYEYGMRSTYFVLLTSNFYNLYSQKSRRTLNKIQDMGHTIGVHFDEKAYLEDLADVEKVKLNIRKELDIMSEILDREVAEFAYHRPSKWILDADICIEGAINAYGTKFFRRFKYLSDSRMYWREPVEKIIQSGEFPLFQILIHPFWYHEKEMDIREILESFIESAYADRYQNIDENMTELSKIVKHEEVCRV